MADAEDLKKRYGCALTALVPAEETVDVPSVGGRKPRQLSRQVLSEIIQPRVEEIFTLVARELARAGFQDAATAGVVVTGGTSIMEGVPELAEAHLRPAGAARRAAALGGLADVVRSPIYATAVGLALLRRPPAGRRGRAARSERHAFLAASAGDWPDGSVKSSSRRGRRGAGDSRRCSRLGSTRHVSTAAPRRDVRGETGEEVVMEKDRARRPLFELEPRCPRRPRSR